MLFLSFSDELGNISLSYKWTTKQNRPLHIRIDASYNSKSNTNNFLCKMLPHYKPTVAIAFVL